MLKLFEFLTGMGAILAALVLLMAFTSASASQQGAAAGIALCFVVIPYCVLGMLQRKALLRERRSAPKPQMNLEPLDF